jgi:predicted DNA-binding transcriptional regulator AlpA
MNRLEMNALSRFDELPGSAHVRLRVVAALFGVSTATVWRWSKSGTLPAPMHINGVTMWNVAALRERLAPHSAHPAGSSPAPEALRTAEAAQSNLP